MGALPNRAKLNHVSIENHGFGVFYFGKPPYIM